MDGNGTSGKRLGSAVNSQPTLPTKFAGSEVLSKEEEMKQQLVRGALLWVGCTLLAMVLAAIMGRYCKAQTFTKDWSLDSGRQGLTAGFNKGDFLFSLSFEYEESDKETFAAPMVFSYSPKKEYGDFTVSYGAGFGFSLEIYWNSVQYDIIGHEITYPDITTDTFFFGQLQVSVAYDIVILAFRLRVYEDRTDPAVSLGFTW